MQHTGEGIELSLQENAIVIYYVWLLFNLSLQLFANFSCISLQLKEEDLCCDITLFTGKSASNQDHWGKHPIFMLIQVSVIS